MLTYRPAQVKFSGFLYIYSSNSTSREVNFDNLKAVHYGGDLQSEFHYYPFGLSINLSQAFGATEAPLLFTSQQFERGEFSDGKGLNLYDFEARMYEVQIGRWGAVDPLAEEAVNQSPHNYALNNPIILVDHDGRSAAPVVDQYGNLLGVDSEGWTGTTIVMYEKYFTDKMKHTDALEKETKLDEYGKAINIKEEVWDEIVKNGGTEMKPFVQNNSLSEVWCKLETDLKGYDQKTAYPLGPGQQIYAPIDGVATTKHYNQVCKVQNHARAIIDGEGDVNFFVNDGDLSRWHPKYGWIEKEGHIRR